MKRMLSLFIVISFVLNLSIAVNANDFEGNIAKSAKITTDSNPELIKYMTDGIKNSNDSRWYSDWSQTHWVELEWVDNKNITNVKIWSGNMSSPGWQLNDFELLYWDGTKWISIQSIKGNTKDGMIGENTNIKFDKVTTKKLRLNITDGCAIPDDIIARILEIEVYEEITSDLSNVKNEATVDFDTSISYQTIMGWGGNIYPHWITKHANNDPTYLDKMLKELNTTDARIRSYWYNLEIENDDDDPDNFNWEVFERGDRGDIHDEFLGLQELMKAGIKLHFASWRFPNWMLGKPVDYEQSDFHELPKELEDEYVESLAAYFLYAERKYGIKYEYVTIANEPNTGVYILGITPKRYGEIVHKLKQKLEANGYYTKYYGTEVNDAGEGSAKWTNTAFFDDEHRNFDALTYHSYRRTTDGLIYFYELAKKFNRPVFVTEFEDIPTRGGDREIWSSAMRNAMAMHDVLKYSKASMVLYFSYSSSGGGLVIYDSINKKWYPIYDMLKQFYTGIPVGSVMVESNVKTDLKDSIYSLAFVKPDGKLELVLINNSNTYVKVNIKANNRTFIALRSDSDDRFYEDHVIEGKNEGEVIYLMTPNSIASLSQTNEISQKDIINQLPNDGRIRILIDNRLLSTDQDPTITNGRTLVPLRAIFEALGATVSWDSKTNMVTAKKGANEIIVIVGDSNAYVNGELKVLDVPATIVNSRTLVPVRFVSESLGATVDWNEEKNVVLIKTK